MANVHAAHWGGRLLGRVAFVAALTVALIVALAIVSQIFLPSIAASRIRSSLKDTASDVHVSVRASPATKLLFGHADGVTIRIGELRTPADGGTTSLATMLVRTKATTDLDATIARLISNRLELDNVSLIKRGDHLTGAATVTRAQIEAALPSGIALSATSDGTQALTFSASATILGQVVSASAFVRVVSGKVEVVPNLPILNLLQITLFQDPRVAVDGLQVSSHAGAYTFAVQGHLT